MIKQILHTQINYFGIPYYLQTFKGFHHKIMSDTQQLNKKPSQGNYQVRYRSPRQSVKYNYALKKKTLNILDVLSPKDSIKNRAICCNYADMEFKFPEEVLEKAFIDMKNAPVQFGYTKINQYEQKVLVNWVRQRYYKKFDTNNVLYYAGMFAVFYAVITQLVKENEQILILGPGYCRFIQIINETKRKPVQYILPIIQTEEGPQFYINLKDLSKIFESHQIKLVFLINPLNPSGKIWTKQSILGLGELVKKYNSIIYSDQVYADSILDQKKFTSLLSIEELHQYMVCASSFTKTFNCSGQHLTWVYAPNPNIKEPLKKYLDLAYLYPTSYSYKIMAGCYTIGKQWRLKTLKYTAENYNIFKKLCKQKIPSLVVFKMQSTYLSIIDFKKYGLFEKEIMLILDSMNVFPTYLSNWFINDKKISICRINLAMNRQLVQELVSRLERILKPLEL